MHIIRKNFCDVIEVQPIRNEDRIEELFAIHLKVLRRVLNGKPFERIQEEFKRDFERTNYLNVMKRSGSLSFNANGVLIGAYPISPVQSPFMINVEGVGSGYAMCAIDALGVAYTFGAKTLIETKDPTTAKPIRISVDPSLEKQSQYDLVVSYKPPCDLDEGSCAELQCPAINFYYSQKSVPSNHTLEIFSFEKAVNYAKQRFSPTGMKKCLELANITLDI